MTETPALDSAVPVEAAPRRRRLGIASLVLALLAILGDLITIVIAVGSVRSFDDSLARGAGLLAVFVGFGSVALVIGLILAAVAFLLAIIALIVGSGRIPAVFGGILSLGTLISHGVIIAGIVAAGYTIGQNLGS